MDSEEKTTVHLTTAPRSERFVPTCPICGNNHWPRDPSCAGKKGAKAKAKVKASAKAKARAKRLGPANTNTYQTPLTITHPAMPNIADQSTQPAGVAVFPPRQNTDIQLEPKQQHGGERVVKIKAKSQKELTSFADEIARIKRQADEVVLRTSEEASHQVQSERTARLNAEEKARNEAAARLQAEQKLKAEITKLKALQEEARQAAQSNVRQMQQLQQEFTGDTQTSSDAGDCTPVAQPCDMPANTTTSLRVAPSYTNSNVGTLLAIRARDVMEANIIWASPEDTISTVLDRMLSKNSHYAIVAANGHTEGIVSRAELTGPICQYLKPFISKWQRPDSDATFNVAVKWIMSRQINSVSCEDTCTAIMKKMRAQNMCPLPVVDEGKTIGLVTPFNVFKIRALLKLESDNSAVSNRQLIQALPARISSYLSGLNPANTTQLQLAK